MVSLLFNISQTSVIEVGELKQEKFFPKFFWWNYVQFCRYTKRNVYVVECFSLTLNRKNVNAHVSRWVSVPDCALKDSFYTCRVTCDTERVEYYRIYEWWYKGETSLCNKGDIIWRKNITKGSGDIYSWLVLLCVWIWWSSWRWVVVGVGVENIWSYTRNIEAGYM